MPGTARLLAALVAEAQEFEIPDPLHRHDVISELPEPAPFNLVHIITGVRRSGKTFYLFQLIRCLWQAGVPHEHTFYFNFADDRLKPPSPTLLNDVVEEYWRQVPDARSAGCYLFLDEVQEAGDWQGFCQRLAEHERVTLVITGSSSKMSADEIATTFRGRSQEHRMMPLSFSEYCTFHDVDVPEFERLASGSISPKERVDLEAAFDRYLTIGGFPQVQHMNLPNRIQLLQAYVRDVVARDVVERYDRADISLANQVALFALRNTACELSVNRLVGDLRKVGYRTSWETVNEIVRLFTQAHLFGLVPEYSVALAPDSTVPQKVYAIDQGMAYAVSRANQQDIGKRFETAVCLELERRLAGNRVESITSYTAPTPRREKVDFLVGDALGTIPYELIQVCVDMQAEKTRKREVESLQVAMRKTGIKTGTIVTLREDETIEGGLGTIHVIPAWKWTLLA